MTVNAAGPNIGRLIDADLGDSYYLEFTAFLRAFDGLAQAAVVDKDLTAPPGTLVNGARYIVAAGATGAWAGKDGQIARYYTSQGSGSGWEFFVPKPGWQVAVVDEVDANGQPVRYSYSGSGWGVSAGGGGGGGMTNPMTAQNDLIVGGVSGAPTRLPAPSTQGWVLTFTASGVAWAAASGGGGGMTNPMTTKGDIIIADTAGAPVRLGIGTNGQVLSVINAATGLLGWATPSSGGMTNPMTTASDLIVGGTAGAPVRLGVGTTGQVLTVQANGSLAWVTPTGGGGSGDFKADGSVQMTGPFNEAPLVSVTPASDGRINTSVVANTLNVTAPTSVTQITGFIGGVGGATRRLIFPAGWTLVHSDPTLLLPTGANIVTRAGDTAEIVRYDGTAGNNYWKMLSYQRADGTPLVASPDNTKLPLAGGQMTGPLNEAYGSANINGSGVLVWGANGNSAFVSGTTGQQIVGVTDSSVTVAGAERKVTFVSPGIILVNSNNLLLPTRANITVANGDSMVLQADAANAWRVTSYLRVDGTALVSSAGFTEAQVRATPLTGLVKTDKTAVVATDTVLQAFGKLQAQLDAGVFRIEHIAATSVGQTSFAVPNGYTPGAVGVFFKGPLMAPADFTATDGANVVLAQGAENIGDILSVMVIGSIRAQDDALLSYTVAQLNTQGAANNARKVRWCNDANGGPCMVVSNGTNWVRVADNAILTT